MGRALSPFVLHGSFLPPPPAPWPVVALDELHPMRSLPHFLVLMLALMGTAFGQHERVTKDWRTVAIDDGDLGRFEYHIYKNKIGSRKPLIVYLQGSKNFPLYWRNPDGRYSTSTTLGFKALSEKYHIVLISKPDTPFVDSIEVAPSGRKLYPVSEEYSKRYSLYWRVDSADKVIEDVVTKVEVDSSTVIVWGHSEGSQVVPAVAVKNPRVTHVISMMGNSLSHLYDFILHERVAAMKGEITNMEAQTRIAALYAEFEKIYSDPESTTKTWFGETYLKWSSFGSNPPLESMLKLDIPILYVAGGEDRHSIMNMDYAKLEFLRKGKENMTYKVFPDCDHFFLETKTDASGKKEWINRLDEVNDFALDWVAKNSPR